METTTTLIYFIVDNTIKMVQTQLRRSLDAIYIQTDVTQPTI